METFQTPRVNGAVLEQFVGQTVCIVGKIVSHEEGAPESQIETSRRIKASRTRADGRKLTIRMAAGSSWTSQYVEVVGHVHEGGQVEEFKSTDFGDSFDMAMYQKAVQLMTGKYSYLFSRAQE